MKHIYVCTPSAPFDPEKYKMKRAIRNLEKMGFMVTLSKNALGNSGNVSAPLKQRLDDLHEGFANPKYDIVMCSRGGWNSNDLLPQIDYDMISKSKKIFSGMSDITTLCVNLHQKAGIQTIYGHLLLHFGFSRDVTKFDTFREVVENPSKYMRVYPNGISDEDVINKGDISGVAIPANTAVLNWLIGTPYQCVVPENGVLFLEDDEEGNGHYWQMYLNRLDQAGYFSNIRGVVIGKLVEGTMFHKTAPFRKIIADFFQKYEFPVYINAEFGHIQYPIPIPFGSMIEKL